MEGPDPNEAGPDLPEMPVLVLRPIQQMPRPRSAACWRPISGHADRRGRLGRPAKSPGEPAWRVNGVNGQATSAAKMALLDPSRLLLSGSRASPRQTSRSRGRSGCASHTNRGSRTTFLSVAVPGLWFTATDARLCSSLDSARRRQTSPSSNAPACNTTQREHTIPCS